MICMLLKATSIACYQKSPLIEVKFISYGVTESHTKKEDGE